MKKNTQYVQFVYTDKDQDLIDILEKYLNVHVEEIFNFFDSTLPRKTIEIHIIPTKREYDENFKKRTGKKEIPNWSIGNYHDGIIEYVSIHDYNNTYHAFPPEKYDEALEYYKKTIVHEYVHFVTNLYMEKYKVNDYLRYLTEGIAQYLSKQRDNIELNFKYSLEEILYSNNCYIGWYLLTKYIIEKYGKEYFLTLLKDEKRASSETPKLYEEAKEYYSN